MEELKRKTLACVCGTKYSVILSDNGRYRCPRCGRMPVLPLAEDDTVYVWGTNPDVREEK